MFQLKIKMLISVPITLESFCSYKRNGLFERSIPTKNKIFFKANKNQKAINMSISNTAHQKVKKKTTPYRIKLPAIFRTKWFLLQKNAEI